MLRGLFFVNMCFICWCLFVALPHKNQWHRFIMSFIRYAAWYIWNQVAKVNTMTWLKTIWYTLKWVKRLTTSNGGEEWMKWTRGDEKTITPKLQSFYTRRVLNQKDYKKLWSKPRLASPSFSHDKTRSVCVYVCLRWEQIRGLSERFKEMLFVIDCKRDWCVNLHGLDNNK